MIKIEDILIEETQYYNIKGQVLLYNVNNGLQWISLTEYEIQQRKKERKQKLKIINEKANSTN